MSRYGKNETLYSTRCWKLVGMNKNSSIKVKLGSYVHDTSFGQISKSESVRHFHCWCVNRDQCWMMAVCFILERDLQAIKITFSIQVSNEILSPFDIDFSVHTAFFFIYIRSLPHIESFSYPIPWNYQVSLFMNS